MQIAATSTEYLHVPVTPPTGVDLTGAPVKFAILPASNRGNPAAGDWQAGEWDGSSTARILVGPDGAITLTSGDWHVWINVDPTGAENIIRKAGLVSVT